MRLGLFFRCSGYGHVSRDCPRAGWTRVVISKGLKTDHYRRPLLSSLAGGRELAPGSNVLLGTPREKEGSRPLDPGLGSCVASIFVFLWRATTCWQSLKRMSHPLSRWSDNCRFLKRRSARVWCEESSATVWIWSLRTRVGF